MTPELDQVQQRVATLKSLPVSGPAPIPELRRRIRHRRHRHAWAAGMMLGATALGFVARGVATRPADRVRATPGLLQRGRTGAHLIAISGIPSAFTVLDADSGLTRQVPVAALNPSHAPYRLLARQGRVVFEGATNNDPTANYGAGFGTFSIDLDHPSQPLLLGTDGYFLPSTKPDRVWLVNHPTLSTQTVREVTAAGLTTVADIPVPDVNIVGTTSRGLLFWEGIHLRLWDPTSRRIVSTIPGGVLVAADGDLVASCDAPCDTVTIADVRTGKIRNVSPPGGGVFAQSIKGAFSPDHRQLAMFTLTRPQDTAGPAAVAVVDTRTGKTTSTRAVIASPMVLAWSSDSKWLFYLAITPTSNQIGAMQPGRQPSRLASSPMLFPLPALVVGP